MSKNQLLPEGGSKQACVGIGGRMASRPFGARPNSTRPAAGSAFLSSLSRLSMRASRVRRKVPPSRPLRGDLSTAAGGRFATTVA